MQIRIVGSPYTMKQEKEPSENPPYFLTLVQVVARFFDDIWVAASLFESGNRRKGDLEATFLDGRALAVESTVLADSVREAVLASHG